VAPRGGLVAAGARDDGQRPVRLHVAGIEGQRLLLGAHGLVEAPLGYSHEAQRAEHLRVPRIELQRG